MYHLENKVSHKMLYAFVFVLLLNTLGASAVRRVAVVVDTFYDHI